MRNRDRPCWLFRVAANLENGGGHVSRSLILAKEMDADIVFSVAAESPYRDYIGKEGFPVVSEGQEDMRYDGIWVDAYQEDFAKYRGKTDCLAIIEDHKDLYDGADIYVRPYPAQFSSHEGCLELGGFTYALIDRKYFDGPEKVIKEMVSDITVFMGRYDSVNSVQKILEVLNDMEFKARVHVVMGKGSAHFDDVKAYLDRAFRHEYFLHVDLPDLYQRFQESDFAILSGGVAAIESCAVGCPTVVMNIAENQIPLSRHLSERGAILYAGTFSGSDNIADVIIDAFSYATRLKQTSRGRDLFKESGARLVAKSLLDCSSSHSSGYECRRVE